MKLHRFFRPHSLRYQLLSRCLYILLGLIVLIGLFQYVFLNRFLYILYDNTANMLASELQSIPTDHWTDWTHPQPGDSRDNPINQFSVPVTSLAVVDSQNHILTVFSLGNHGQVTHLPHSSYEAVLRSHRDSWQLVTDARGDTEIVVLVPLARDSDAAPQGVIQASSPVEQLDKLLEQQVAIYVVLGLLAFAGGVIAFLPLLRRTLSPLSSMVETVRRINAGNLDERFMPGHPQEELALLSDSFNDMLERLHQSFEKERESSEKIRQFVADASHELRTPLTSIHGFLEVLLRGAATNPDQLRKSLTSMYNESERMKKLVQDLILLARLDREPELHAQEGPMEVLLLEMEPQLRMIGGHRQVRIQMDTAVMARFDLDKMKQVLLNLFHNAVQHTHPTEGRIEVSLVNVKGGAELSVRDNGNGIPPEHLSQLFERFYRVDTARARKDGGVGLGLAITKSIVDQHGGTIACDSIVNEGTVFRVWIPS